MDASPPARKRRKRRKKKPRDHTLRNSLIGAAVVMGLFTLTGLFAFYEKKTEEDERQKALTTLAQPTPRPVPHALAPIRPSKGTPVPPGHLPLANLPALRELKLGMAEKEFKARFGQPDFRLGDHRFFYGPLGIEVAFRPMNGGWVLSEVKLERPQSADLPGGLDLPGLEVGASPTLLATTFPHGRVVYHRELRYYTLYDPARNLAIDFTPHAIKAIRLVDRFDPRFAAERSGPGNFDVKFDQAFAADGMLATALTDAQIQVRMRPVPGAKVQAHLIDLRLKVDAYDPEDLRSVIKRRVNDRVAAGDLGLAITVTDKQGHPVVQCDWFSPRYLELTGQQPQRFGTPDSMDNISYRWF